MNFIWRSEMGMMVENKVWTEKELMSLPQDDNKYELAELNF
jgi:hypothetical protein